jgi:hypothetical protein
MDEQQARPARDRRPSPVLELWKTSAELSRRHFGGGTGSVLAARTGVDRRQELRQSRAGPLDKPRRLRVRRIESHGYEVTAGIQSALDLPRTRSDAVESVSGLRWLGLDD